MTTKIHGIQITTKGKAPGDVNVTVTAEVTHAGTSVPTCRFPAQSEGTAMHNTGGNTWNVSDSQMYDGGEKTLTVSCNGTSSSAAFKP